MLLNEDVVMRTDLSSELIQQFSICRTTQDAGEPPKWLLLHPADVLECEDLGPTEKRAILASWASDERVVEDAPALRWLESGVIISVDEILRALKAIDEASDPDDDPPPASAARVMQFRPRPVRAVARNCATAA